MLTPTIMRHKDYWTTVLDILRNNARLEMTDPEKFDPDRFYKVEESDKYLFEKRKIKNAFLMFGGGAEYAREENLRLKN